MAAGRRSGGQAWAGAALLAAAASFLTGCAALVPPAAACGDAPREYGGPVVGAFRTTIASVRDLQGPGVEPPFAADRGAQGSAVVCYIAATIPKAPPLGPNGEVRPDFDRIVVVIDGRATLIKAGYRASLPVVAP
ncbi:MAG: hypothetical protein FIA92_15795 [Chloroflexi bacterium]|nr:hypothetical protein [Chloroflexota bacterium]